MLRLSRQSFPFVAKAFADAGYAGVRPAAATIITVVIVREPPDQVGFAVHPRRWVVEHLFAWISRRQEMRRGLRDHSFLKWSRIGRRRDSRLRPHF